MKLGYAKMAGHETESEDGVCRDVECKKCRERKTFGRLYRRLHS